jgi:hypothetical protein
LGHSPGYLRGLHFPPLAVAITYYSRSSFLTGI